MKTPTSYRLSTRNKKSIDDVAVHTPGHGRKHLTRGEALDLIMSVTTIEDITNALRARYHGLVPVEPANRAGLTMNLIPSTIEAIEDLASRIDMTKDTVVRLAIEAYYVKFLSGSSTKM